MTRLYPGMLDHSKEYFASGDNVFLIHDRKVYDFHEVENHSELAQIISDEPELEVLLTQWFGADEKAKLKTLAKCRFGGLNFFADINEDEVAADYCPCPMRGKCAGENIICKPTVINGEDVSTEEIKILREVCTDEPNRTIAGRLGYALGTFNVKKNNLYQKLGIKTKQHAVKTLVFEGLL